nr:sodium-dependent glucose transporter 1 [Solea senegalensis]
MMYLSHCLLNPCLRALPVGGNVFILNVWGEQAGPSMQAMHFSWAAGAFVSPIIAKLLFGLDGNSSMETMATNSTLPGITTSNDPKFLCYINSTLGSMWAYIMIGTFLGLVAFLFFLLFTCTSASYDKARTTPGKRPVAKHHKAVVVLLAFFYFFYVGAEVMYGSFIYNYAKDYARMPQAEAAGLNSLFWATFAVFRGLAVFLVACLYPGTLILLSLVGCTLSSLLHCLFSREKVVMWSCSALYGASMATTFPSGISWLEQYTAVTGNVASVLVVGAALGEMVLPTVLGFLLGKFSEHPLLMYLSLIMATITSILFPVIYKLAATPSGQSRRTCIRGRPHADDSEFCQALLDSGAKDEDEEEEEGDEPDTEADQWNDADFEVIEMDDAASLVSSPDKTPSPLDATASPPPTVSFSGGDSPRRKLLLSANREKRD